MGKNKVRIQGYISPYLADKIDKLIGERGFSSRSEFVSHAIQKLVTKLEETKEEK